MIHVPPIAYIDPMSGSILLQLIVAGVLGAIAFFHRSIWRLLRCFRGSKPQDDERKA